jgi:hypothetical protein
LRVSGTRSTARRRRSLRDAPNRTDRTIVPANESALSTPIHPHIRSRSGYGTGGLPSLDAQVDAHSPVEPPMEVQNRPNRVRSAGAAEVNFIAGYRLAGREVPEVLLGNGGMRGGLPKTRW